MSFPSVPHKLSAAPLASLPGVVFDTETTGLDAARDRIIEIGAVRLAGAGLGDTYSTLVRPGIPIPPTATSIHGLGDADVADAPGFGEAAAAFSSWVGASVVIGFSVGFDLAVLKAEHDRAELGWSAPRSLDVRHLTQLVAPELPELSLELAAEWLGVEVTGRHRALGDARVTARLYLALVPKLRERGIATLAQAERACRAMTERMDTEAAAGWHVSGGPDAASGMAEYARIDSFPYRHRVGDLMRAPPLIVDGARPLNEALTRMVGEKVSSLFVKPDGDDPTLGIVTERDVLRALESLGADALKTPVAHFTTRPLVTVARDEFAYRALTRMAGRGFRHLGVLDAEARLVGALSARDLLRQRAEDAVSLGDSIDAAEDPAALGRVWSELTAVAHALVREDVDARDVAAIASRELRALTRRACELAEQELKAAGRGGAPRPYALMVLGSGGRGESLLAMDQDNAIVYADGSADDGADGEADAWFEALGKRIADILDQVGVSYCKGGVMASNQDWRQPLSGWRTTVGSWITKSRPQDILNCDIFFDAAPVYGDTAMAQALLSDARDAAQSAGAFLNLLQRNAAEFTSPLGWFGQLKRDNGRVDLKAGGIMPIFSAARVVALANGVAERSTPGRLKAARALGIAPPETIDNLVEAHRILLGLILQQQLADIGRGLALGNKVAVGELGALERKELRWALDRIASVGDLLGAPLLR